MSPFEELYGRKIIPVRCGNPEDRLDFGLEKLEQMEPVVHKIKQILKTTQDRQKKVMQTTYNERVPSTYISKSKTEKKFLRNQNLYQDCTQICWSL